MSRVPAIPHFLENILISWPADFNLYNLLSYKLLKLFIRWNNFSSSLELGISFGMALIAFIFAYYSILQEEPSIKWMMLCLSFGTMSAGFNIFSRLATSAGMDLNVISMFDELTIIMIILT